MSQPMFGEKDLQRLQRNTFNYFWKEADPKNGLLADNTSDPDVPASIAAVGWALAAYVVGAERGWVKRAQRLSERSRRFDFSGTARKEPKPTRPAIGVFIITSST